jgi:hypothetical protein
VEIVRPAVRVQLVVPQKLPHVTVKAVSSRLDGRANNAALEIAEFSRRVAGDEIELFDSIRCWCIAQQIIGNLIVIHAVKQEVVRLLAIAVDQRT